MDEKKYLRFGNKLAYGSGDFAANFAFTFVSSFIMIFLSDTIGLNTGIIGVLMMVSKLLDGVTDVIFGTMIDKTKSKMGKARVWMFWSTFPLGLTVLLQFAMPNVGTNLQYAYFFIIYTLMNAIFFTANNIAYSTLTALITANKNERVQLGVFRFIFALIAALVISSVTPSLVTALGGGVTGWRNVALIYAAILIIINTISVLGVKELPDAELNAGRAPTEIVEKTKFIENFKYLLNNRFYLLILGLYILQNAMSAVTYGSGIYYMTYILGNASLLGLFSMASMFPMIIGLAFTPMLVKKWGMHKTNLISMSLVVLFSIPVIIAGASKSVTLMLVFMVIRGIFLSPLVGTLSALIAETSHHTLLKHGVRIDGTMFSCSSMGVKVGSGIGSAAIGWLLAASGYNGLSQVQPESALSMISFTYLVLPAICFALMTLIIWPLKVEKANQKLMEKQAE